MAKTPRMSNILVVDEYDGWRQAMSAALEELGYVVWTAECGRDALDLFFRTRIHFDLIVSAQHLSDMSGSELGRRMHSMHHGVRVLFTCWPSDAGKGRPVLQKPFSLVHLDQTVRRTLSSRGQAASRG